MEISERKRKYDHNLISGNTADAPFKAIMGEPPAKMIIKPKEFQIPKELTLNSSYKKLFDLKNTPAKDSKYKPVCSDSYKKLIEERKEFRKYLLTVIKQENRSYDQSGRPNYNEKMMLRYHYYINHGVSTVHIPPIADCWLRNILRKLPISLKTNDVLLQSLITEIKKEYLWTIKKSVVDFALQDPRENEKLKLPISAERFKMEICRCEHFQQNKTYITENLFIVHPSVLKIRDIWDLQYGRLVMMNVEEFQDSTVALNLFNTKENMINQIENLKKKVHDNWICSVCNIILKGCKKKSFSNLSEAKKCKFYKTLYVLMTLQIQSLCLITIERFSNFLCCVKKSPGFIVHLSYENNKIKIEPYCEEFKNVFINMYRIIVQAVSDIPSIEYKLHLQEKHDHSDYLKPTVLNEITSDHTQRLIDIFENEWICPELKIQDFDDYIYLINGRAFAEQNDFFLKEQHFDVYTRMVSYFHNLCHEMRLKLMPIVCAGIFQIYRERFISVLIDNANILKNNLLVKISGNCEALCSRLNDEFENIYKAVLTPPNNTAELVSLKEYCLQLGTEILFEMEDCLRDAMDHILFEADYMPLTNQQIKQNATPFLWYKRLESIFERSRNIIEEKTIEFQRLLEKRIEDFNLTLSHYMKEAEDFRGYRDVEDLHKYLKKAQNLNKKLDLASQRIKEFNEEEITFGWRISVYPKRDEIANKLSPYKDLYENCVDYKNKYSSWTQNKIGTFQPTIIETEVQTFYKNITELNRQFSQIPAPYALTNLIRQDIELFQSYLPLVKTLGNPHLKERHWEKVSEVIGFPLRVNDELTLAKIFDYGLEEYVPKFQLISDSATKENILENELTEMMNEWTDLKFNITRFRETDAFILLSVDEIQILLDDHIVKIQMMKNSPYIKPFEVTIRCWEDKLIRLQEIIDCWFEVQRTWIYLQPVFAAPDIQQQMPEEARRFSAMDKIWKEIMKSVIENTNAMVVIEIERLLERFNKCNTLLDMVQRGLNGYLEIKRTLFPRFFFLSNEEILKIISKAKDLVRVQSHLKKCFNGIYGLTFTEDCEITAVRAESNEELTLNSIVDTRVLQGQVEKWLFQLELNIKSSIFQNIVETKKNFNDIYDYVGMCNMVQQVALVARNLIFTERVTNEMNNKKELENIFEKHKVNFNKLVNLLQGNLTKRQRSLLGYYLVADLYFQDILISLYKNWSDGSSNNFNWISRPRYSIEGDNIIVNVMNTRVKYACEYFGDVGRIIITPETERCIRSVFLAIKYDFNVCVTGLSGLGKTEMIKEVSRMVAKPCYIFNCSNQMNYLLMEKLFKGLISFGPFVCFTNLTRLNENQLSVFAYYSMKIHQAMKYKSDKINFNNNDYKFDRSCLIFSTIRYSCGNAPETELRYNTNLFCRYIYMKYVDYIPIITAELRIIGFIKADALARKIVSLSVEFSEIMFNFDRFHFNLNVVRRILLHAEKIKRNSGDLDECEIIYYSIKIICEPMLADFELAVFNRIMSELFPEMKSSGDTGSNHENTLIRKICAERNLHCDELILNKVKQLFKIITSHVGVMIVGEAFSGKTTVLQIFVDFIQRFIKETKSTVHTVEIYPKTLLLEQLYGYQDSVTWEWNDGVFSAYYRKFSKSADSDRKILIMDGPLDSLWAENLSTTLNSSGKLHLSSGESIHITNNTNVVFETDRVANISPALPYLENYKPSTLRHLKCNTTGLNLLLSIFVIPSFFFIRIWQVYLGITRCGIIYVPLSSTMWKNLIYSWLHTLPALISEENRTLLKSMSFRFCSLLLYFLNTVQNEFIYPASSCSLVQSLINIYNCFLEDFEDKNYYESLTEIDVRAQLEGIFFFSCIWSFGAILTENGKNSFDILFRSLMNRDFPTEIRDKFQLPPEMCTAPQKVYVFIIPEFGTVFDYQFIKEGKGKWKLWSEAAISMASIPRDITFNQIMVPTKTSVRNQFLLSLLMARGNPVLLAGDTATGKTADVKDFLKNKLDKAIYKTIYLNFSLNTTASFVQNFIIDKLDKRKRGVFGPPLGMKYVLFIDDLSYSSKDEFGCRSSVELLRQWLEHKQWYDHKSTLPIQIIDLQLVAAVTTPRIRNVYTVCPRFSRYFNIIATESFEDDVLKTISNKIMLWHLDTKGFSKDFDPCINQIADATLAIYKICQTRLLPTPMKKLHYDFNVRNFFQVIQGVILSVPEAIEDLIAMKRLWIHEVLRVFQDRLISPTDNEVLFGSLRTVSKDYLNEDFDEMFNYLAIEENEQINELRLRKLMFCDFINPKADIKNYSEVQDLDSLQSVVEGYLIEYNNMTKKPMNLVLSRYLIEHLARICRILKQPQGHPIMIGNCGSGRQCAAKLAAHICEYESFQIEITSQYKISDWRTDLKNVLLSAYTDQHSVLLLTDNQIIDDSMLEDVCNLILVGEVPNLFNVEDKKQIIEKMELIDNQRDKNLQTDGSQEALFNLFIERVYRQIHVILVFTLNEGTFHGYIRKFPTLTKCYVLDWFQPWPSDVLKSVGDTLLHELFQFEERILYIDFLQYFYKTVREHSDEYKSDQRINISSKSYIKLVSCFKHLYTTMKNNILQNKRKYQLALQQLLFAEEQIPVLNNEHAALQPAVVEKRLQVEHAEVAVESEREAETEREVALNAARTTHNINEKKLRVIKEDYAKKLEKVQCSWDSMTEVLRSITPADLNTLRSMKNPPKSIKLVVDGLAIAKEIKGDAGAGKILEDSWKSTVRLLADPKFIDNLIMFDKDNVPPKIIKQLEEKILNHPEFNEDKIKSVSLVAEAIYKWLISLHQYDSVVSADSVDKLTVTTAEEKSAQLKSDITQKEQELKSVREKRQSMEDMYEKVKTECNLLEKKEQLCSKKKERAEDLVRLLNKEKTVWPTLLDNIEKEYTNLIGNALIGSAFVTFLGCYNLKFRERMIHNWSEKIRSANISLADSFSVSAIISNPIEIEKEYLNSLPDESFLVQAVCILKSSQQWPFIIDPQGIMKKWIRMKEKDSLIVININNGDFLRSLENAVHIGSTVLLEDISGNLDATLFPLLEKRVFKTLNGVFVKIGDATVEYNQNFRLYMTTVMADLKLQSELYDKLCVINCDITKNCLEPFVKRIIVSKDKPEIEAEINQSLSQRTHLKITIYEEESKISELLSSTECILESETGVTAVEASLTAIEENSAQLSSIADSENQLKSISNEYNYMADKFSIAYRVFDNLKNLNPAYCFSYDWFIKVIEEISWNNSENNDKKENIVLLFISSLYRALSKTLLEMDAVVFLLSLVVNVKYEFNISTMERWKFFLSFDTEKNEEIGSSLDLISVKSRSFLMKLISFDEYKELLEDMKCNENLWKSSFSGNLPLAWNSKLNNFQKLLLQKCINFENTTRSVLDFIKLEADIDVTEISYLDLMSVYNLSNCSVPVFFLKSKKSDDPVMQILNFANDMGVTCERCIFYNFAANNGIDAMVDVIGKSIKSGFWLVLLNWQLIRHRERTILRKVYDSLYRGTNINPDFRLWIILSSNTYFPFSHLSYGIKIKWENSQNMRNRLHRLYAMEPISDSKFFNQIDTPAMKRTTFLLCLFHCLIERKCSVQYCGFNNDYYFDNSDLSVLLREVYEYAQNFQVAVDSNICQLIGQYCYGGEIADECDIQYIKQLLAKLNHLKSSEDLNSMVNGDGTFVLPYSSDYSKHLLYIVNLPYNILLESFGIGRNIELWENLKQSRLLISRSALLQIDNSSAERSDDSMEDFLVTLEFALKTIPTDITINSSQLTDRERYCKKKNVVEITLVQELFAIVRLLDQIKTDFIVIRDSLRGHIIMTAKVEEKMNRYRQLCNDNNKNDSVQQEQKTCTMNWLIKKLTMKYFFLRDLLIEDEQLTRVYQLSTFSSIKAIMMAIKCELSWSSDIPIYEVELIISVLSSASGIAEQTKKGIYIDDIVLENASWNATLDKLDNPKVGQLQQHLPLVLLTAERVSNITEETTYKCPFYEMYESTSSNDGASEYSYNFVTFIYIQSSKSDNNRWILNGTRLLCKMLNVNSFDSILRAKYY